MAAAAEVEAFDVVVVGGGAAGCVVAARLAESGSRSVLLLEAGADHRAAPPGELKDGWRIPREPDWGYAAEADARGVVENLTRGKLLGGTSWMTRFALRGSPADYDEWAALGNAGWSFDDALPFFMRLEADAEFGDQPWHGDHGPIPITRYPELERTEILAAGLDALEAIGFPHVEDHNRPGSVGAGWMPMSSHDGTRVSAADAYLPLDATPSNLTIRADAHVAEVVFNDTRAAGVKLVDGTVCEARSVVLAAGAYGSPAILMRSGIGPAEHLASLGIPVRAEVPGVGGNLVDHAGVDIDCGYRGLAREAPILHIFGTFTAAALRVTRHRTSRSGCRIPAAIRRSSRSTSCSCGRAREARCGWGPPTRRRHHSWSCRTFAIPPTPRGSSRATSEASSSPGAQSFDACATTHPHRRSSTQASDRTSSTPRSTGFPTSPARVQWAPGPTKAPWSTPSDASTAQNS
jgi:choline dehydrogenase-like flavoprotein